MSDLPELIRELQSEDIRARATAAEELCQLGEEAQSGAVALARAAGDQAEEVREWACSALEGLGPPLQTDVEPLATLLDDDQGDTAYWAATLLGRLGEEASAAVDRLASVVAASTQAETVRERAAWALGKIGRAAESAVETLQAASQSQSPRLARLAAKAIQQIQG